MTSEEKIIKQLQEALDIAVRKKEQKHIDSGPELLITAESIEMVSDFTEWELKLYTLKYLQIMKNKLYELQSFDPLLYYCPGTSLDFEELNWDTQPERILKNIPLVIQEANTVQQCLNELVNEVEQQILKYEYDLKKIGEQ